MTEAEDQQALEDGRRLFAQECWFVLGAAEAAQVPDTDLPEVAFAGRSNVGKSSLVNALTGRKALARTARTPGRTRQINFFDLGRRLMLADLPGYGYAKAPKGEIASWNALMRAYLKGRASLRRVCLLVDARRGLSDADGPIMVLLDEAAVAYQAVLTKCDKLKPQALAGVVRDVEHILASHAAAHPAVLATSAHKGTGIEKLRAELAVLAGPRQLG